MKFPTALQKKDIIQVVAPAGSIVQGDLDFAEQWCEKQGWALKINPEIYSDYYLGYHYAGADEHRAQQIQQAIDHPNVKAIWFARGGYGSVKIIDQLNFEPLIEKPKYLIGYSDITVFHNHLNNLGIPTLHGVTAKKLKGNYHADTYTHLAQILKGEIPTYTTKKEAFNEHGTAQGTLVGGNLSIVHSLLASPSFINCPNPILFLEDWYEDWYSIDRMWMSLQRSGFLKQIKGLILGSFTKMDEEKENPNFNQNFDATTYQVIRENAKKLKIPKLFGFPAGHTGHNLPLIMGAPIALKVDENGGVVKFKKP